MNFLYIVFSTNVSMNNCRMMSLSDIVLINVFQLCSDIKMSSKSCKKHNLNHDVNEYESHLNDVSSMNENELLNDKKFFEMIDKKVYQ